VGWGAWDGLWGRTHGEWGIHEGGVQGDRVDTWGGENSGFV